MTQPTVDAVIVIVNYNGGETILRCLAAVADQSVNPARVVVVDNASADGSPDRVAERFPEVVLVRLDRNRGFAGGNNAAISHMTDHRWTVLLNPDAFPRADWLEHLTATAEAYPEAAMVASHLVDATDPSLVDGSGDVYHWSGRVWRRDHGQRRLPRTADEVFAPCAAAALYRTDLFVAVGGFDDRFFCYLEDIDLAFRLRLRGGGCRYAPDAVVEHVGSAITGEGSDFSVYYGHRNLVWTFVKNMPGRLFWQAAPLHIALNVVSTILFILKGRGGVILRAKRDALLGLPTVWRERQAIQKNRTVPPSAINKVLAHGIIGVLRGRSE